MTTAFIKKSRGVEGVFDAEFAPMDGANERIHARFLRRVFEESCFRAPSIRGQARNKDSAWVGFRFIRSTLLFEKRYLNGYSYSSVNIWAPSSSPLLSPDR